MTESEIQRESLKILKMLEVSGAPVYSTRTNSGSVKANGGYVHLCRKGWPDVTCCIAGRFVGIEFKSAKGSQSADQKAAEAAITAAGGRYVVIRSTGDLFDFVETAWSRAINDNTLATVRRKYNKTVDRLRLEEECTGQIT